MDAQTINSRSSGDPGMQQKLRCAFKGRHWRGLTRSSQRGLFHNVTLGCCMWNILPLSPNAHVAVPSPSSLTSSFKKTFFIQRIDSKKNSEKMWKFSHAPIPLEEKKKKKINPLRVGMKVKKKKKKKNETKGKFYSGILGNWCVASTVDRGINWKRVVDQSGRRFNGSPPRLFSGLKRSLNKSRPRDFS